MELHHKVPRFLGGSEEEYNIELITKKDHFNKHLEIAIELDTADAWASCVRFFGRIELAQDEVIKVKVGLSKTYKGEGNPAFGKPSPFRGKSHTLETLKKQSECKLGNKNPMYGKVGPNKGKAPWNKGKRND